MVKVASLSNQLLKEFPSDEFEMLVKEHEAEKGAKRFTCRTQFVAMLFRQLAREDSLREICNGLSCCLGKLVHLGVGKPSSSPKPCGRHGMPGHRASYSNTTKMRGGNNSSETFS